MYGQLFWPKMWALESAKHQNYLKHAHFWIKMLAFVNNSGSAVLLKSKTKPFNTLCYN